MRVAHFVHRYPPALGGSEAFMARLSRYLAAEGDEVALHTTTALDLEAFWSDRARTLAAGVEDDHGVRVRRHALLHWPLQRYALKAMSLVPIRLLQCATLPCNPIAPSLWRLARHSASVDVVHATAFPYAFPIVCALRLARRWRAPFVLTPFLHLGETNNPHDRTRRGYLSPPLSFLLMQADHVFAQTTIERDAMASAGVPANRISLLGMGVDAAECTSGDRQRARARWQLPPEAAVIGHLANKSVEKGTVDLLAAFKQVQAPAQPSRLLLAGPEMPNFLGYWNGETEHPDVVRVGVLTEEEKRDFYAAIDIFCMPSRSDSFGIVFLEAWANGIPCVAYRAGGVAEVIRHEQDGLLVECGELGKLADALRLLNSDPALRGRLGAAGQARTLRDFTWLPRLQQVRETYQRLVGTLR